jgi:hypothetical protein
MFVSRRPSNTCGVAAADIYETRLDPALGWLPPEILPCATADDVNSFADEFSPSLVEAAGRTILFFSSARDGTQKIYTSERRANGEWGPAEPVDEVNSGSQDARPNVSYDGLDRVRLDARWRRARHLDGESFEAFQTVVGAEEAWPERELER